MCRAEGGAGGSARRESRGTGEAGCGEGVGRAAVSLRAQGQRASLVALQCRRRGLDPWVRKIPWRRAW